MYKNYLIFLKHCLALRFDEITIVHPHSYLTILVTRKLETNQKNDKIIRLRRAAEKALAGRIRPANRSLYGPDIEVRTQVTYQLRM